jgi:outer membrane protein OmpA-like peptidoglycan-associated protein
MMATYGSRHARQPIRFVLATLVIALLIPAGSATARKPKRKLYEHVVSPGESCWSIARLRYGTGKRYDLIHRYNDLGPLPHMLKPGQRIKVPHSGKIPDAQISWLHRDVKTLPAKSSDWMRARKQMSLWRYYKVSTGDDSSAGVEFDDRSKLRMRQDALLIVYGPGANKSRLRGRERPAIKLERGIVRGGLASLDKKATLTIRTPMSKIRLQSRSTQIEVDKAQTRVFVFDGKAQVSARGKTVTVNKNEGTVVEKGKKPQPPRPLPSRVKWAASQKTKSLMLLGPKSKGRMTLRWRRSKTAKRYRVEIARNAKFYSPLVDTVVSASKAEYLLANMKPGSYYARIAAIDEQRMEGPRSKPLMVRVVGLNSSRTLNKGPDGVDEGVGVVKIVLPRELIGKCRISLDGGAMQAADAVRLHSPGLHVMTFKETATAAEGTFRLRLLRVNATLSSRQTLVDYGADRPTPITLLLQDERGRPVVLPGLYVDAVPGRTLPLKAAGRGRYIASLRVDWPMISGTHFLRLIAGWAGGPITAARLRVRVTKQALSKVKGTAAKLSMQHGSSGSGGSGSAGAGKSAAGAFRRRARPKQAMTAALMDKIVASDPDADGDGIPIPQDKCPKDVEDFDNFRDDDGCPDKDNDQDGIPDSQDKCPLKPETVNGVEDDDGCPDEGSARVVVSKTKLELADRIFFQPGKDTLKRKSYPILKQVAAALKAHFTVRLVQIEGHTDDRGDGEMNVDLSERRARRVLEFLVKHGVASHRLKAVGFGPKKPIASNKTGAGRSKNRRVEFNVLKIVQVAK